MGLIADSVNLFCQTETGGLGVDEFESTLKKIAVQLYTVFKENIAL